MDQKFLATKESKKTSDGELLIRLSAKPFGFFRDGKAVSEIRYKGKQWCDGK